MMTTPLSRFASYALLLAAPLVAGCDKSPLLAPTQSTITVSAGSRELPSNGTTQITAVVTEQAGTAVQNGTTVRFSTTLGHLDPVESQTRNGAAVTTFFAANSSGVARIRAISGSASGGETEGNLVEITVGAAAVNTVTLRANPGSVGPDGGTVELIAAVVSEGGQPLQGILVTFSADQGTLSNPNAVTNASGEARTQLTTTQQAVVSATAGTKTSSNVTVAVRSGPIVTITCAPVSGTGNCAAVPATGSSNTATVVFTVTRPSGSSTLRTATIDFGDGSSQSLGNLAGGTATVTHIYTGPSNSTSSTYTATVQATDINGETAAVSTTVVITPRAPISVSITDACGTATVPSRRCTFTATVTGGGEGTTTAPIQSYTWDFGDSSDEVTTSGNTIAHVYTGPGTFKVTVTVRTVDGRTANGTTQILVP
jgi:PKD domain-containing protein/Big-like domain-containing protein